MRWRDQWPKRLEHLLALTALVALVLPLVWRELRGVELVPRWGNPYPPGIWLAILATGSTVLRQLAAQRSKIDRFAILRAALVLAALLEWQMHPESWRLWRLERPLAGLWLVVALLSFQGERRSTVTAALLLLAASISSYASRVTAAVSNCDCACQPSMWTLGYSEMAFEVTRCAILALGIAGWAVVLLTWMD